MVGTAWETSVKNYRANREKLGNYVHVTFI